MNNKLYVVGIGASAGGLDAIQQVFDNIPIDTGMAFVIVQHLSPDFKSLMPELLAKHTGMKIYTAADGLEIKPNCIYLNQRQKNLIIVGNKLHLSDKAPKDHLNLPIDIFFTSLGEVYKEKAIAVVLSGTGSDGSRGIKVVSEGGGIVIVQEPISAQFDGMPNAAIATHLADYIVTPDIIGEVIEKSLWGLNLNISGDMQGNDDFERTFVGILKEIHKQSGIDFSEYKRATILRRLEKRIAMNGKSNFQEYLQYVKQDRREREALKQDFFIGVTSFFRDPKAYHVIKSKVIPSLVMGKKKDSIIRVWVAGCSTGEEVYSLAILLDEHIRSNNMFLDFKIFATDIDNEALVNAGAGVFPVNITSEVERHYLENYFVKVGEQIQIIKRIRERVVFSQHNLMTDPPFIRMDLISCRNLLIYLDAAAQQRIYTRFQFALEKSGYLFLGSSESLGDMSKYFNVVDAKWKIYTKNSDTKLLPNQLNPEDRIAKTHYGYGNPIASRGPSVSNHKLPEIRFLKYLTNKFAPTGIVTDSSFNVLYIVGDVSKKLVVGAGLFQGNLMDMVSPELSSIIRTGVRKLTSSATEIRVSSSVPVSGSAGPRYQSIDVIFSIIEDTHSISNSGNHNYFIGFVDGEVVEGNLIQLESNPIDDITAHRLRDLEEELKFNRVELQNATEELETSNEELQSSNEELMASNEELQSTNEELQSVNEELYTVNAELQEKNRELSALNNDMSNLFNSTDIGTLFLDVDMNIRKFTPALKIHFSLRDDDIGRNIKTFAPGFDAYTRNLLIKESERVLRELVTVEHEITSNENTHHLMRISPFITADKMIDGLIISFIDIQNLRRQQDELLFLNNINRFMEEEDTFEQFLKQAASNIGKLLKIPVCNIYIVDAPKQIIYLGASSYSDNIRKDAGKLAYAFTTGHSLPLSGNHTLSKVVRQKTVVRTKDPEKAMSSLITNVKDLSLVPEVVKKTAYSGMVRLPLKHLQTVMGILEVPITETNLNDIDSSLDRIANQLALTIHKFESDKKVREFQSGFQSIVDATPIPIMITRRKDTVAMFTNKACLSFFNIDNNSFEKPLKINWIKEDSDRKEIEAALDKYGIATGKQVAGQKPDGTEFWALYSSRHMEYLGEECTFHGVLDITERAQTQQQLERLVELRTTDLHDALRESEDSRNKLNFILMAISEGILVVSPNGRIQMLNPFGEKLLGLSITEVVGKRFDKCNLPPSVIDAIHSSIDNLGDNMTTATHDLPSKQENERIQLISTTSPVLTKDGELKGYVTAFRDVTLERAVDLMKTEFIATAAHQLRTPLTSIQGFSELMSEKLDYESQKEYSIHITEQAQVLSNIINELLDIAKIESGDPTNAHRAPMNVRIWINSFLVSAGPLFESHQIKVSVDLTDEEYEIDANKLAHCLRNLISNATIYTGVKLPIELHVTENKEYVTFSVKDFGAGMTEDQISHAFDRFWRADSSDTAPEGSGLGLNIVRNYVTSMGGTVTLESAIDKGTTVTLFIPRIIS
jgi:PAS domain S-box-containing protein